MNSQNITCIFIKKYIPIVILLLATSSGLKAQTFSPDNFVSTAAPKKAVSEANYGTLTKNDITQNITYFDGLGRPIQTIAIGQGGDGENIVTPMQYDAFGRQVKEYLPYPVVNLTNNHPKIDPSIALGGADIFYKKEKYQYTANAFSEKQFELSPLNRVQKQAAPGASWKMGNGNEIKIEYKANTPADAVKIFKTNTSWKDALGLYEISFSIAGNYAQGELYKTITYDENSGANPNENAGSTVEFKNKEGQIILKRTYDSGNPHDTYYVYDDYGNLTYVIPPKAADLIGTTTNTTANLTSTAVLLAGNTLNLTASNSITLLPGFHAQAGSTFSAVISDGTQGVLDQLCYQYKYDNRNRLVEKKLPGKQWEFIVYDKLDRPVATGPARSPFSDINSEGWMITKYDAFSRPVYTGWNNQTSTSASRKLLQDAQNVAGVLYEKKQSSGTIDGITVYYSNTVAPTSFKLLTVNYYDAYTYPNAPTTPSSIENQPLLSNTKGLATGSWTRVLTTSASTAGETATTFYDPKARPLRTYTQNYLGGYTYTDSSLDAFSGQLKYSITRHKRAASDGELTTKEVFTYSAQDRLLTQTHQINNGPVETIVDNTYDELGQLITKKVGNNTQKIDYSYNIRGWLTGINDVTSLVKPEVPKDLFAFKINYDNINSGISGVKALYNGNISETSWATNSDNGIVRSYGYKYDNLNRLKEGIFQKAAVTTNAYNETLSYDKNGNIMGLSRNGSSESATAIDALVYTYANNNTGNQLMKVTDNSNKSVGFIDGTNAGDDYAYDLNGNMVSDANKNIISITYNHLNLPTKITFATTGNIVYIYNAAGQKLQKIVNETGKIAITTDYLGGYQYDNSVLKFFPTAEGYIEPSGSSYQYIYQYKDHLGNVRLSYDKTLAIKEENNYYPFGLKHNGYNPVKFGVENKYKYNGQELQDELGLNVYDYDNRIYDPATGRFLQIDPLAEQGRRWSPYNYCFDNPMYFRDPDGMWPILPSWNEVKGTYNQAKNTVSSIYNQTKSSISRTYNETKTAANKTYNNTKKTVIETTNKAVVSTKETLKEGQKWVKDNKEQLIGAAKEIQKVGDNTTKLGLVTAVAGAPVAGVGASPGLAVATAGGAVNLVGTGLEAGVKFISGDYSEGASDVAVHAAGEIGGIVVDKLIPGPNPDVSPEITELFKAGKKIIEGQVGDKAKEGVKKTTKEFNKE
ncbi:DUF6443 domain-containing protein [Flavobacterium tructae]|uniref:DUF6443 domain-containing protein n=1 Tax=Flavobacterium tructae TaxID=1114873 RepID=UPI002551E435|nr:DUF6443 domain-containing protein [Flavobacterium tructae]MDL2142626.1 DUF6443 domain-containing protein [Flavobacterium tructae]